MKIAILLLIFSISIFAQLKININACYGNENNIIIEGLIANYIASNTPKVEDSKISNLIRKLKETLFNKAYENKKVNIKIGNNIYNTKTDDEGFFEFETSINQNYFNSKNKIYITLENKNIQKNCNPIIITKKQKVGVISDFDDTLIVSNITKKSKLLNEIFLKNYKQREIVANISTRIKDILLKNGAFFIISGSPKQFDKAINSFLDFHKFPKRVVITKKFKGKNADSITKQFDYKYKKIDKLIKLLPHIKWVMFGDSGEQDLKIYKAIAKRYPQKIKDIYIRNVKTGVVKKILRPY